MAALLKLANKEKPSAANLAKHININPDICMQLAIMGYCKNPMCNKKHPDGRITLDKKKLFALCNKYKGNK